MLLKKKKEKVRQSAALTKKPEREKEPWGSIGNSNAYAKG